ncbi:MAG TPA: hypothetical protein VF933_24670 [Streptosporangiaceae bacterium]
MNHNEWPDVNDAITALRQEFLTAYVEHTGGGCFSIYVPIEGLGFLSIGDIDGPLGTSNQGWSVELTEPDGEYGGPVCNVPDRSVPKLVEALRAFVRDGTRTGLTRHDLLCMRRDRHHAEARHFVNPVHMDDPGCAECQEIYQGFQEEDD